MDQFDDTHEITLGGDGHVGTGRLLTVGEIIGGSYRLKSLLGKGGMGYVFCAEHSGFNRDFALKMLAPEQVSPDSRKRFVNEGRVIAALNHANIVKVYDMALDGGQFPFYVMDLLAGQSLAEHLSAGISLTDRQWLEIFCQIVDGLAYAHDKGIIHRDVKPSNIIILPSDNGIGQIKIVDFGIAKFLDTSSVYQQSQTATGTVFGSPFYMSPEQCMGSAVDARSDIYSAGCTFFELLSGEPPYRGKNALETVLLHQSAPVPSLRWASNDRYVPFDHLIARMLAKKPEDRYQTMAQVRHDLERLKEGKSIGRGGREVRSEESESESQSQISEGSEPAIKNYFWTPSKALAIAGAAALLIAAVICAWHRPEPVHVNTMSSPIDILPELKVSGGRDAISDSMAAQEKEAPDLQKAEKDYAAFHQIYSKRTRVAGVERRVFYFPKSSIGVIYSISPDAQPAVNKVVIDATSPVNLTSRASDCAAIDLPQVFDLIAPGEFNAVDLTGHGKGSQWARNLQRILQILSRWTALTDISISAFDFTDEVVLMLTHLPHIENLKISISDWKSKTPGDLRFWQSLKVVKLLRVANCQPVLTCLQNSQALQFLQLESMDIPFESLKKLSSCPHLKKIELTSVDITDALIDCLSDLKNLRTVMIDNTNVTVPQIRRLMTYPNLQHIRLRALECSRDHMEELQRLGPPVELGK